MLSRLPHDEIPFRSILERNVSLPAAIGHAWRGLRQSDPRDEFSVARWIEPTFEETLRTTKLGQPLFCFLNFCDAHEPYYPWPEVIHSFEMMWRSLRTRQDRQGWLSRKDENGSWDLDLLHRLYRSSIRSIDHRIQRIVESLQRHGRWQDTLFVLTSDHGQAFGEKGMMYHRFRVDESMIRIPLWVRFPQGRHANKTAVGWASLVDVVPTVLESVGQPQTDHSDGRSLVQLIDQPRPEPVMAVADGTMGERWIPASRQAELDRVAVAVFTEASKITYTETPDELHAYDILQDPRELEDVWTRHSTGFGQWSSLAKDIAMKLRSTPETIQSPEVMERLRAWGYL
jgi:arylsulfatase A-like enzyme